LGPFFYSQKRQNPIEIIDFYNGKMTLGIYFLGAKLLGIQLQRQKLPEILFLA